MAFNTTQSLVGHTHTLADVTDSGGAAALDVGTTSSDVSAGDHAHGGVYEPANASLAKINVANVWAKGQQGSTFVDLFTNLTTGNLDFETYQNFFITLSSNANSFGGTSLGSSNVGQSGVIVLIQPGTLPAGTAVWHTKFKLPAAWNGNISGAVGQFDVIPYTIKATDVFLLGQPHLNFA